MKQNYFSYLKNRTAVRFFLRRVFLSPVVKYFSGKVLDIGAGIGEFLDVYHDAIGVDLNEDCVSYCSSRGLICVQGNIYDLPFAEDSFDGVLLNNILEHLERPDDAFLEVKRVLKHKGKLMIELPGRKGFKHDRTHVRFWGKNDISDLLKERGFIIVKSKYFPVPFKAAGDLLTHNKLRIFALSLKQKK